MGWDLIVRGLERKRCETRNSRHMALGTWEQGVCGIEGRLGVCVWAVDIDTFAGGEFRCIALLMAADF